MKKTVHVIMLALTLLVFSTVSAIAEMAPQKIIDLAHSTLADIGSDPTIVAAVKEQNNKGMSLEQIKTKDAQWKNTPGLADYMKALMTSACAKKIKAIQASAPYYAEIFVMDNQGANVAMTDKTSDYWQGDEAKFQKSFAGGTGAVFVDEVEFDDSSQAYLAQVSVPVKDGGKAIGAITFGIDVDKVQ